MNEDRIAKLEKEVAELSRQMSSFWTTLVEESKNTTNHVGVLYERNADMHELVTRLIQKVFPDTVEVMNRLKEISDRISKQRG